MGREGLACKRDWSANRAEVLADKQSGWSSLEGNQVYLDIVVGGRREQMRRLVFALFLDEVPLAAANFHALCTHKYGGLGDAGQPLTYKRSCIHRIARGQFLQGGELHGLGAPANLSFPTPQPPRTVASAALSHRPIARSRAAFARAAPAQALAATPSTDPGGSKTSPSVCACGTTRPAC